MKDSVQMNWQPQEALFVSHLFLAYAGCPTKCQAQQQMKRAAAQCGAVHE